MRAASVRINERPDLGTACQGVMDSDGARIVRSLRDEDHHPQRLLDMMQVRRVGVHEALFGYRMDGHPLPECMGGPLRLFVPETDDRCANVKNVIRIELIR